MAIKELLEYQKKEAEKLAIEAGVEEGKAKRELDSASEAISNAQRTVLALENDAKVLLSNYSSISKNLAEIFDKIAIYNKNAKPSATEEEATSALSFVSGLLSKVSAYEAQLNDIANKINTKTQMFEDAKTQAGKAQKVRATAGAQYESDKAKASGGLEKVTAELKTMEKNVDKALLEKYKTIRKSRKKGDIVVPVKGNRCGGCHFELSLSHINRVSTSGYIICEECDKIIYKA